MTAETSTAVVSHRDIINRANGPASVARLISEFEEREDRPSVESNTTKAWNRTDSIPSAYWEACAGMGIATLEELAAAAASKRAW